MARRGRSDALSLLSRSAHPPLGTVPVVEFRSDRAVKRVRRTERELGSDDPTPAEQLLTSGYLQQAMARKCIGWAPVHDVGSAGDEAHCATERFPRSAQTVIDGRRRLPAGQLRVILTAVVDALIELQVAYNRPHGNLKPTNVLLGRRVRPGTVCLTDPAANSSPRPSLTRAPDPRAIGRLLFALVTHRPHTAAGWPMRFDADWAALGWSGPDWFELCKWLLNPRTEAQPDLDEVMTRIVAIRPTRRRPGRWAVVLAMVAVLVVGAYGERARLARWGGTVKRQVQSMASTFQTAPKKKKRGRFTAASQPGAATKPAAPKPRPVPTVHKPLPMVPDRSVVAPTTP